AETEDGAQGARRHTDAIAEPALQGAALGGTQRRPLKIALGGGDLGANGRVNAPIARSALILQPGAQGGGLPRRIARRRRETVQPGHEVQPLVRRLDQGAAEKLPRAVRLELGGDDFDRPHWTNGHGPGHLTGEDYRRLKAED